jgi:catechol 2,3-dioxygenase-like lactoylglutathione lyase family enzyme
MPRRAPSSSVGVVWMLLAGVAAPAHADEGVPVVKSLEHVTLFVRSYDEALAWYVDKLGMVKVDDRPMGAGQRWLTVAPSHGSATNLVLAIPSSALSSSIGHQHNWVYRVGDCHEAHKVLSGRGVKFLQEPRQAPWGCQAIIEDLYGNRLVLLGDGSRRQP